MTAKTIVVGFILAFTSSLLAADAYIYDPNKITEKKASESERCGPYRDQPCYNIFYDGLLLIKNVPDSYLPYFVNLKKDAITQNLPLRARCNPLDVDLKSSSSFLACFYTLFYSQVIDNYEVNEIELISEGLIKKDYKVRLQGAYDFKIDERIHDRLKTLKISATKKTCKIKINVGFLDPLLFTYGKHDLNENFKLDLPDDEIEASGFGSKLHFTQSKKMKEAPKCVICQEEGADLVLLPCSHLCAHIACWQKVTECPICKTEVKDTLQVKY